MPRAGSVKCFWIVLLVFLFSCKSNNEITKEFEDYSKRLSRVLMLDPSWDYFNIGAHHILEKRPVIGRIHDRVWPNSEQPEISLWSLFKINGCLQFKQLISNRNNQLGQHQEVPARLNHEWLVRVFLHSCLKQQEAFDKKKQVEEFIGLKKKSLQPDIWNTFFARKWFSDFAYSNKVIGFEDHESLVASAQALEYFDFFFDELKNDSFTVHVEHADEILNWFKQLDGYKTLGMLATSLLYSTHYLKVNTNWISAVNKDVYCPKNVVRKEHQYFKNVIVKIYVGRIQPYLSHLSRDGGRLLKAMDDLLNHFDQAPGVMDYWSKLYRLPDSIWNDFLRATKSHAEAISELNKICSLGVTR